MSFINELKKIFVTEDQVPEKHRLAEVHQREYLSNGEMLEWAGNVHEAYSPVCIRTESGLQRKLIGTYPVCTEKGALEALDVAVAAYDNGQGQWRLQQRWIRLNSGFLLISTFVLFELIKYYGTQTPHPAKNNN